MKFQDTSIHRLKVKKKCYGHTETRTHGQAQSNMPYQLFQSWGHKKIIPSFEPHVIIMRQDGGQDGCRNHTKSNIFVIKRHSSAA